MGERVALRKQRIERKTRRNWGIPAMLVVWAGIGLAGTYVVAAAGEKRVTSLAHHEARAMLDTVVDFSGWSARRGGVWVELPPNTNPNLPAARIRKTSDGKMLVLINPAQMIRRVGELSAARDGPLIRLTSLEPERPENAPLPWEREALESFARGAIEYAAFADLDSDAPRFRYAAPLRATACPNCDKNGVRGAITVSLPAGPMVATIALQQRTAWTLGALLVSFGVVAILLLGHMTRIQKEALAKLRDLSLRDPLTGLHNRRGFSERSQQALSTLSREKGSAVLAFADLDGLKTINDTYGHKRGDEALIRLANSLKPAFRGSDVVARIGGDEFAILFVDAEWRYRRALQGRIDTCVTHANRGWNGSVAIEVSVGMVDIDFSNEEVEPRSVEELLSLADTRMYAVKVERRNTGSF